MVISADDMIFKKVRGPEQKQGYPGGVGESKRYNLTA